MEYKKDDKDFLNGVYIKITKLKLQEIEQQQILEQSNKIKKLKIRHTLVTLLISSNIILGYIFIDSNSYLVYILCFFLLIRSLMYENIDYLNKENKNIKGAFL